MSLINNKLIIAEQNVGKTTYLYNQALKSNKRLIILDSATEHIDKSLLLKIYNKYSDSIIIDEREINNILLDKISIKEYLKNYKNLFPLNKILNEKNICFDLSYFLEKGYEVYEKTKNINDYKYFRNLYNQLSNQIVFSLILAEKDNLINDIFVLMDEIELPIVNYDISEYEKNIEFLAAVHPENAFGTFYKSFEKVNFKKYVKRKD